MVEAAEKAGRSLLRDFGEVEQLQVSKKGPGDFVSNADLKSEKIIRATLEKARPKFGFLLEEGGEVKGEDASYRWIVDPLDGTSNFLHGIPHWSVSIALEKDKEIIAGVIYDPVKDELFYAEKGTGAFSNTNRLRVSGRTVLADSLICIGTEKSDTFIDNLRTLVPHVGGLRRSGGACLDLAYVAAGRFEAFFEQGLHPWDAAAGALLVKEAGGKISELNGEKNFIYGRNILAANAALHADMLKKIGTPVSGKVKTAS
jgi:myo-inositol-1(or 4)-monophosphatase